MALVPARGGRGLEGQAVDLRSAPGPPSPSQLALAEATFLLCCIDESHRPLARRSRINKVRAWLSSELHVG